MAEETKKEAKKEVKKVTRKAAPKAERNDIGTFILLLIVWNIILTLGMWYLFELTAPRSVSTNTNEEVTEEIAQKEINE